MAEMDAYRVTGTFSCCVVWAMPDVDGLCPTCGGNECLGHYEHVTLEMDVISPSPDAAVKYVEQQQIAWLKLKGWVVVCEECGWSRGPARAVNLSERRRDLAELAAWEAGLPIRGGSV